MFSRRETPNKKTSHYARPWWLGLALAAAASTAVAAIILTCLGMGTVASAMGDLALIATLLVLMLYTFYTSLGARAASYPAVSFGIAQPQPQTIQFHIHNHSKVLVNCWCKLNPTFEGKTLPTRLFMAGEKPWPVLPFSHVHGAYKPMEGFFAQGPSWDEISALVETSERAVRVHFKIQFWYEAPEFGFQSATIEQRYYFDIKRDMLVLDY